MEAKFETETRTVVTETISFKMTVEEYRALSNVLNKRNSLQCSELENMVAYKIASLDIDIEL